MKSKLMTIATALTLATSIVVVPTAQAAFHGGGFHGGWHGGGWHGGGWHGRGWGIGAGLVGLGVAGALLAYPYGYGYGYGYPYYGDYYSDYVPTTTVVEGSPTQVTAVPQTSAPVWYYCQSPKGYYPYVPSCSSGWQTVPATPPH